MQIEQEPNINNVQVTRRSNFLGKFFEYIFYFQCVFTIVSTSFFAIRGSFSNDDHHFHPIMWYPPLLTAIGVSAITAFLLQSLSSRNPFKAMKAIFWFMSPIATILLGSLIISVGNGAGLGTGILVVISGIAISLNGCRVIPRLAYAIDVLSHSLDRTPPKKNSIIFLAILAGVLYSCFLVAGIGGIATTGTRIDEFVFVPVILFCQFWTMQVIKNIILVTVSRVKYIRLKNSTEFDTFIALRETLRDSMGSICMGSISVPVFAAIYGFAQTMKLLDFCCANCCFGFAVKLVSYGNRWGFVHVGEHRKGIVRASMDTLELLKRSGLEKVISSDLNATLCFLCGVAGGSISGITGGAWALAVHKSYVIPISLYAFLIGYFMSRIAMAWLHASVMAYYVAFAENPRSIVFLNSPIPGQIEDIRRLQNASLSSRSQIREEFRQQIRDQIEELAGTDDYNARRELNL